EAFLERGQKQEALADLARAPERKPEEPVRVHVLRAKVLEGMGQLEESLAQLDRALELEPSFLDGLQLRGSVLDRLGRGADAARDLERALAQSPHHALAAESLAWLLLTGPTEARDPRRALELARKAAEQRPDLVYSQRTLGLACYRAGLIEDARAALERAVALPEGKTSPSGWVLLSMARARSGDVSGARQALDKGSRRLSDPACRRFLGPSYLRRIEEMRAEAEAAIKRAVEPPGR
ncbi:MAG: tetratricopeptide repeat protein, partial [Candidatus Methylomirabilales bacterium]